MAKSQTFGKRENEKKKQAKRLEKQKRREERQAGGSSSLDDMIAYVDENGNITDTPPQLRPKVEIQLEDIVIATPKKEDIAAEPSISIPRRGTGLSRTWLRRKNIFSIYLRLPKGSARGGSSFSNSCGVHAV